MLTGTPRKIRKPKPWRHSEPITRTQLAGMRDEFWDTVIYYGGQRGIVLNNCEYVDISFDIFHF